MGRIVSRLVVIMGSGRGGFDVASDVLASWDVMVSGCAGVACISEGIF